MERVVRGVREREREKERERRRGVPGVILWVTAMTCTTGSCVTGQFVGWRCARVGVKLVGRGPWGEGEKGRDETRVM